MIRGRKEGSNYATWFISFDNDDTFGLTPFPELPPQSTVLSKPVTRAVSLETLLPASPPRDPQPVRRSLTPAATPSPSSSVARQTFTQTTQDTSPQNPHEVSTQTTEDTPTQTLHKATTQTTTTYTSTETFTDTPESVVHRRTRTSATSETRPKSEDFDSHRSRRRKEKDAQGLYKEAFDGARRTEEFKFRVKFDKLIEDLHVAIEERTPNGLTSFASPSYGDMMLTFKDKVKELLKGFTQRLQLAYESFGSEDTPENNEQKVKQNISKFIEELIGETIDLTSDEAVSDLSSLSDESTNEQNTFENLIAQAVISKLFENHQKEINKSLQLTNNNYKKHELKDQGTETTNNVILRFQRDNFTSYDSIDGDQYKGIDNVGRHEKLNNKQELSSSQNGSGLGNHDLFNYKSDLIPDDVRDESDTEIEKGDSLNLKSEIFEVNNKSDRSSEVNTSDKTLDINRTVEANRFNGSEFVNGVSDEETDIVKEFEQLKEFVTKARTSARPIVKAIQFDDSGLCEVKEDTVQETKVDRDEEREEFHTKYSILDRIHNWEPALPDFSQFDNIDFASDEVDPDLLSMNLAIIPEETEEELEQEEEDEQNLWKRNWLFTGKGVSPYENMGKKKVNLDSEGSLYMMVPRPDDNYVPKIGHREIDQLSDFSEHDLLGRGDLDGSDEDEENTFYANTSKELARISGQRNRSSNLKRQSSGSYSDNSDFDGRMARRKAQQLYDQADLDYIDNIDIPGPIVEPNKQELKLLHDLVPADNDDPKFVLAPESVTVQEGEPVKFSCRVAGTASVDVFWYREGDEVEELEESEDIEITSAGDKHSIVLYNISKKMEGQYMCIALNEKGKAIQYLVVTVKDNKQELKKPEFLKGLKDVEVTEGQSVKFRVKVKGYPPPRISWYKDGELLKNSKTCRIEKFGNRDYILTIDYASMNDDAEYTVSARNVAGEERMSAQVIVEPQSDLPVRRQRASSYTTSGASDSDSDKSMQRRPLASASSSSTKSASKQSIQENGNQMHINHLDIKVALTQVKVEEEAQKMQGFAKKDETSERKRLITADTLDVLQAAEEIIQKEKSSTRPSTNFTSNGRHVEKSKLDDSTNIRNGEEPVPSVDITTNGETLSSALPPIPALNPDTLIEDLALPDTLDEFPLMNLTPKASGPHVSSLELSWSSRSQPNHSSSRETEVSFLDKTRKIEKSQPIVSQHESAHNQNGAGFNVSVNSYVLPVRKNSVPVTSSALSETNSGDVDEAEIALNISRQQLLKEQYSRDFEIPSTTEKRKWSVTLDPFSPQAEVVNKQSDINRTNEKMGIVEISVTDCSPSSTRSLKGDNSSQSSSRRQSTDSGVSVSSKQKRPAPVHMVGHTTEEEVPESRTEFNTDDGSIELPSVNRLKAMFSGLQDDDLGDGSFKRVKQNMVIHSITARNVPKEKLEKLRARNQNESSSLSSDKFLEVPGSSSASHLAPQQWNNNQSMSLSSNSTLSSSKVTSKAVPLTFDPAPMQHQKTRRESSSGAYLDLNPDKEPVLIYPETDPDYIQRRNSLQLQHTPVGVRTITKSDRAPVSPNQNQTPAAPVTKVNVSPLKPPQPQQTKLLVRRAAPSDENENVKKSGPRIRSGCISARAAFWERRIVDGGAVDEAEFPEMVEDSDT